MRLIASFTLWSWVKPEIGAVGSKTSANTEFAPWAVHHLNLSINRKIYIYIYIYIFIYIPNCVRSTAATAHVEGWDLYDLYDLALFSHV